MKIYVSHEYGGKKENADLVEDAMKNIIAKHGSQFPDITFVSPIHALGFAYDQVKYETGLKWCLDLLGDCDVLVYFKGKDNSTGVKREKMFAWQNGIPVIDWGTFTDMIDDMVKHKDDRYWTGDLRYIVQKRRQNQEYEAEHNAKVHLPY